MEVIRMKIKQRSVGLCILLSFVTCGLYGLYWMCCLHKDVSKLAKKPSSAGKMMLLTLVTFGIYMFYWMYKQGKTIDQIRQVNGSQAIVYLLLSLFGLSLIALAIMQSDVNQLA